jgi:glycosyltransferase involved in cell wall biosynthesis
VPNQHASPSIAIVHEWLSAYAGSERVTAELLYIFPEAELHCIVDFMKEPERSHMLHGRKPKTTFIQHLPFAERNFRTYFPFLYPAVRGINTKRAKIVLTSSHAFAHSVKTQSGQLHICYCHAPMRYIWDMQDLYFRENGFQKGMLSIFPSLYAKILRYVDKKTAQDVDYFIANSAHTADKIRKHYGRESKVIYPPVDIERFSGSVEKEDYYFSSSRFVSYKKNCLLVEAFMQMPDKQLFLAGEGKFLAKLRGIATPNITFLNYLPFEKYKEYMQKAKAFVFAAEEDFGITLVEAQASGTPAIAFCKGGASEIIKDGLTGILFSEQTADSIIDAVNRFEEHSSVITSTACRKNADRFSKERFQDEILTFVAEHTHEHKS